MRTGPFGRPRDIRRRQLGSARDARAKRSSAEKWAQLSQKHLRYLLGDEMAAWKRLAGNVGGTLLPRFEHLILPVHGAFFRPQRQSRTTDLALQVRLVMSHIDRSAC